MNKIYKVITHFIWYSEKGSGKVVGRFLGLFTFYIAVSTWMKVQGIDIPQYYLIIAVLGERVVSYFLGKWYISQGFLKIEVGAENSNNEEIQEILRRTKNG